MIELTKEDYDIFQEIEKRREEIIDLNKTFDFIDYGAGSPDAKLTKDQMYNGVRKKISTKEMCRIGLKGNWVEFLYKMVKKYKPKNILELGTCCGFSSIYMSKANPSAVIYTIEGSKELADIAKENIEKLNCNNIKQIVGRFQDVLSGALEGIGRVDFAFIDGHHDRDATIRYYETIKPYLSHKSIVIFDDISWSDGMKRAWEEIRRDPLIEKYEDLGKLGICFIRGQKC